MSISSRLPNSGMHSIHPLTKLYLTICIIAVSFFLEIIPEILLLLLVASFTLSTQQRWNIIKRLTRYVLPVVLLILLLNVMFYPESQRTIKVIGLTVNEAGLLFGLGVSLRLLIISLALLLFFDTTPIHLLSTALLMKGANPRIIYVFVYSLQLVDALRRKIKKISIAQAARGLNVKGNPVKRLRAFFAMLLPLIFSYLSESLEQGLALELRGLGIHGPKTFLLELKETKAERTANRVFIITTLLFVLWRIAQWLFL